MTKNKNHNRGRIGVLMGGVSSERDISLKSGEAVFQALLEKGHDVVKIDITSEEADVVIEQLKKQGVSGVFIALHGQFGEDGQIQEILENEDIVYTGSNPEASRLAFDKVLTQNLLKKSKINIAPYVSLTKGEEIPTEDILAVMGGDALVVKPATEGSSIGVSLISSIDDLPQALDEVWRYDNHALIEKYIKGRELTVGIVGHEALPVVEIRPKGAFFDYQAKYEVGLTEYDVPAKISDELSKALQEEALKVYDLLKCEGFARVDFIVESTGTSYVLEINTIPGFTQTSLLPKAAKLIHLNFSDLCERILEIAYGTKKEKQCSNTTVSR